MGRLIIKPIDRHLARELIITNHYSHKWVTTFGIYSFGIFLAERPDECLGCAAYGYMKNPKAQIFEHPNPDAWMIELNRMWIDDALGANAETILISASIKLLRKMNPNIVAIQSFADGRLGCGTIYKAANFKYYGYHYTRFLRHKRTGEVIHEQLFNNTTGTCFLRNNIPFLLGDFQCFMVKTYRYIYPLCKKFKPRFREQPYPLYEKGEVPSLWTRDTEKIKRVLIEKIQAL